MSDTVSPISTNVMTRHTMDRIHASFAWVFCSIQQPFSETLLTFHIQKTSQLALKARLYPCLISHGLFFYCSDLSLQSLLKCQTLPHFKHFIVLRNQVFLLWNFLWSIACLFTLRHLQNSLFSGWLSHFSYISTFEFNYNQTHLRGI